MIKKTNDKRSGVQLPPWAHPVMVKVAKGTGRQVKDAYLEAVVDWLTKVAATSTAARAIIDEATSANPEARRALQSLRVVKGKPA